MAEEILGAAIAVPGGINNQKINSMKDFETNYTPAPWRFDDLKMKIKGTGDIDGLTVIANVSPEMDFSRGMRTQTANARLIAAAPELLDALCAVLRSYEAACPERYYSDDNVALADDVIKKAIG